MEEHQQEIEDRIGNVEKTLVNQQKAIYSDSKSNTEHQYLTKLDAKYSISK